MRSTDFMGLYQAADKLPGDAQQHFSTALILNLLFLQMMCCKNLWAMLRMPVDGNTHSGKHVRIIEQVALGRFFQIIKISLMLLRALRLL